MANSSSTSGLSEASVKIHVGTAKTIFGEAQQRGLIIENPFGHLSGVFPPDDPRSIHVCLTHLHLDHLEGLRFFAPLWDERVTMNIWGPPSPLLSLRASVARSLPDLDAALADGERALVPAEAADAGTISPPR